MNESLKRMREALLSSGQPPKFVIGQAVMLEGKAGIVTRVQRWVNEWPDKDDLSRRWRTIPWNYDVALKAVAFRCTGFGDLDVMTETGIGEHRLSEMDAFVDDFVSVAEHGPLDHTGE